MEKLDLNGDGQFDKEDLKLAGKALNEGKKLKGDTMSKPEIKKAPVPAEKPSAHVETKIEAPKVDAPKVQEKKYILKQSVAFEWRKGMEVPKEKAEEWLAMFKDSKDWFE